MAEILSMKKIKDEFIVQVNLNSKEQLNLRGHTTDLVLFSANNALVDANISQRGKNGATKYFLIPRNLRKDLDFNSKVSCHRIDYNNMILFAYVVDKILAKQGK